MVNQFIKTGTALASWPCWRSRLDCCIWLVWLVALVCAQPVWAQVSDHQRLGVESGAIWEADIELSARLIPSGYTGYGLPDLYSSLSLGLLLDRKWSVGLSVPASLSSWSGDDAPWFLIPGDLTASVGWTGISGDSRLWGRFSLTGPSARWQDGQEVPGSLAGGSGRWTAGLSGGISRIIDPLVLGGYLSWSIGLPRTERWTTRWRPGDFSLVLSVTEAFNEHVSCTLGLSQYASLPERVRDAPDGSSKGRLPDGAVVYDASAGVDFRFSGRSSTCGIGFSKSIVHGADPGSVDLSVGYVLRQREWP